MDGRHQGNLPSPFSSFSVQIGQSKTQSEAEAFKTFNFFEQIP
jgi:hypothetical protein